MVTADPAKPPAAAAVLTEPGRVEERLCGFREDDSSAACVEIDRRDTSILLDQLSNDLPGVQDEYLRVCSGSRADIRRLWFKHAGRRSRPQ